MRFIYIVLFLIIATPSLRAQIVNIPDANFKYILVNNNVVDIDGDFIGDIDVDTNNDGEIQVTEAEAVLIMNLNGQGGASSIEGIESFVNLTWLDVSNNGLLTFVDISQLVNLESLHIRSCELTNLDVTTNINLKYIDCGFNLLTNLDISQNIILEELRCYSMDFGTNTLDVSNNPNLHTLYLSVLGLDAIDVSQNPNLEILNLWNNQVTSIDVSQNPNLVELILEENNLSSLDVSQNLLLEKLSVWNNQITSLDVSSNTNLIRLLAGYNNLTSLNVANGNNTNMLQMFAQNNDNLTCIQVDDETVFYPSCNYSGSTGWCREAFSTYRNVCIPDTTPPVVVTQDVDATLDENGTATISPLNVNNGSTDNVTWQSNLIFSLNKDRFNCDDIGSNTVILTVTDQAGNSTSGNATVNINDEISPTVITQNLDVILNLNGEASVSASEIDNGSSDNCAIATMEIDIADFTCSNLGPNTVTLTITDVVGNSAQNTAVVNIIDNEAPNVFTQNIMRDLNGNPSVSILPSELDNGTTDNCNFTLSLDQDVFTTPGSYSITLFAEDSSENINSEIAIVTIIDSTLGMSDNQSLHFSLSPNPTNGTFVLGLKEKMSVQKLRFVDITGQILPINYFVEIDGSLSVDVGTLPPAIYFLLIETQEGISTARVVIQ